MLEHLDDYLKSFNDKRLILVFVNKPYLPIFERWLRYFRSHDENKLLVIALDNGAHEFNKAQGIDSLLIPLEGYESFLTTKKYDREEVMLLNSLWVLRVEVFQRVIDHGIDIIHSDSDAFWLSNPIPDIINQPYEVFVSVSDGHPRRIVDEWGFCLCMGFFFIRSTQATKVLFTRLRKFVDTFQDDQEAFNVMLRDAGIVWRSNNTDGNIGELSELGIVVRALDTKFISRKPEKGIAVYHAFLKGSLEEKLLKVDEDLIKL